MYLGEAYDKVQVDEKRIEILKEALSAFITDAETPNIDKDVLIINYTQLFRQLLEW